MRDTAASAGLSLDTDTSVVSLDPLVSYPSKLGTSLASVKKVTRRTVRNCHVGRGSLIWGERNV